MSYNWSRRSSAEQESPDIKDISTYQTPQKISDQMCHHQILLVWCLVIIKVSAMSFQTPAVYQPSIGEDGTSLGRGTVYSGTELFHVDEERHAPWSDIIKRPESGVRTRLKSKVFSSVLNFCSKNFWPKKFWS